MEPGKLTPGQTFSNVGLTRALLQRADLNGQDCLDIGTMEGLLPILMQRRGARSVTAYDRPSALTSRIASVKKRFDADFDFVSGFPLAELPAKVGHRTFDVVVMSGVLYHLFSPLAGLAIARGLLRNGGLMIVETGAIISDEMVMYWNSASRFKGEAYFYPSVACLDYFARFLRMEVIDSTFLGWGTIDGLVIARVAFACRAVSDVPGDPDDHFIKGTFHTEVDVAEHLDWKRCLSTLPPVPYDAPSWRPSPSISAAACASSCNAKRRTQRPFQPHRQCDWISPGNLLAASRLQIARSRQVLQAGETAAGNRPRCPALAFRYGMIRPVAWVGEA
jgi:SAM-dependent methyltransferase